MALKKTITIQSIGVPAAYHVVDNVNVSKSTNFTSAVVLSYFTEETFRAGKQPLSNPIAITLAGVPPEGSDFFHYAEQALTQKEPADGEADPSFYPGTQNRYLFADAEIVA